MSTMYVIRGKHEDALFRTAVAAVEYQIENIYQYEDDEVLERARGIVESNDERAALRLLRSRSDWEYEGFDTTDVLG